MENDQNWYRQLAALTLLSASRAAVEYLTNPSSRENATKQLKAAFAEIDYDSLASAMTRAIDQVAETSKSRLDDTIDTIRSKGVDAVEDAKEKAESKLAPRKGRRKMRFLFGVLIGGLIAYFMFDEQRRDELLDRLTGASGPIQTYQPPPPSPVPSNTNPSVSGAAPADKTAEQATQSVNSVTPEAPKKEKPASSASSSGTSEKK